jgi:hypothetical protein
MKIVLTVVWDHITYMYILYTINFYSFIKISYYCPINWLNKVDAHNQPLFTVKIFQNIFTSVAYFFSKIFK